jgi:hypothetical protein
MNAAHYTQSQMLQTCINAVIEAPSHIGPLCINASRDREYNVEEV